MHFILRLDSTCRFFVVQYEIEIKKIFIDANFFNLLSFQTRDFQSSKVHHLGDYLTTISRCTFAYRNDNEAYVEAIFGSLCLFTILRNVTRYTSRSVGSSMRIAQVCQHFSVSSKLFLFFYVILFQHLLSHREKSLISVPELKRWSCFRKAFPFTSSVVDLGVFFSLLIGESSQRSRLTSFA